MGVDLKEVTGVLPIQDLMLSDALGLETALQQLKTSLVKKMKMDVKDKK